MIYAQKEIRYISKTLISEVEWSVDAHKLSGVRVDREKQSNAENEAIKNFTKLMNKALIEQKIDTLKITLGHLQTGTKLNEDYFVFNINKLYEELKAQQ